MLNIILYQHKLLVKEINGNISLPDREMLLDLQEHLHELYLSETEHIAELKSEINIPGFNLIGLRQALNNFPEQTVWQIIYFQQLIDYYKKNIFCGSCSHKTVRNLHNKFVFCDKCNHEIYPHIAPCVIVRIHKGNEILMARGVGFAPGAWGLIAGFVEIGESLEQAIHREVKEEIGIEIENIKFWGSQPWSFPSNSLMIGFTADYKSGELILQPEEIENAGFFGKGNLPGKPATSYSIAHKMIQDYIA